MIDDGSLADAQWHLAETNVAVERARRVFERDPSSLCAKLNLMSLEKLQRNLIARRHSLLGV